MPEPRGGIQLASRNYRAKVSVDFTQAFKKLEETFASFERYEFADIAQEISEIGVKSMQQTILNDDKASFSSLARQLGINRGPGRYRTGRMYNSVGGRLQIGAKTFKIIVGYIKGTFQDYFKYQDRGFWNKWKLVAIGEGYNGRSSSGPNAPRGLHFALREQPKWTEGTYALRDARQKMVDSINPVVAKAEKKFKIRVKRIK